MMNPTMMPNTARSDSRATLSEAPAGSSFHFDPRALPVRSGSPVVNAMSVDVEEFFQVGAFENCINRGEWDGFESRLEGAMDRVLALFAKHDVQATFFVLGWIAERHGALIGRLIELGHEVASHGYGHARVTDLTPEAFREDIRRSRATLEDLSGQPIMGYRAPNFSISDQTLWALEILAEEGYRYSSSVYPIHHDHYGMPAAPRFRFAPFRESDMVELPVSTVRMLGRSIPCGGGGYFRLLPYGVYRSAVRRLNSSEGQPAIFYFHPWEIDPGQPRVAGAPARSRFRHYTNLGRMEAKLDRALGDFRWDRMDRVFVDQRGAA